MEHEDSLQCSQESETKPCSKPHESSPHPYRSILILLTYFPKIGVCDLLAVCVSLCPPVNFWMPEPIFMELGVYIMAPELILTACMSICVLLLGNGSVNTFPRQRIHATRIGGRVVLCTIRVVSKESPWICLCIPLSLLSNEVVNTFPRQRRIAADVVSFAVHVVSKESMRLVLHRSSCLPIYTWVSKYFLFKFSDWDCVHFLIVMRAICSAYLILDFNTITTFSGK
jgi:hypothetical protein